MTRNLVRTILNISSSIGQAEHCIYVAWLRQIPILGIAALGIVLAVVSYSMAEQADPRLLQPNPLARVSEAPPAASVETPASPTKITNALRLTLRFRDDREISGDYRVNADETISIPVVGRIQVSGVDAAGLERILSDRLAEITGQESHVSVEVAEYRPIYVTGYVKNSRSVEWHPRMTVLQAVALADGLYRSPDRASRAGSGPEDLSRLQKVIDDQKRDMAALARVRAEKAGLTSIEIPQQLVSLVGRAEAERLINEQAPLLVGRRVTFENQLALLDRGKSLASQELESLKRQTEKINEQLKLRRDANQKFRDLQARGLVLAERGLEQEIQVSQLEEKSINVAVATARIQATLVGFDRDAAALRQTRQAEIDAEALSLEHKVAQNAFDIGALKGGDQAQLGENAPGSENARVTVSYSITRHEGERTRVLASSESTLLAPDDVLVVTPVIRSALPQQAFASSSAAALPR